MTPNQIKKLPNPNSIPEERLKILVSQYEDWIGHPNTLQFVRFLKEREEFYVTSLTEHILKQSDKEKEDRYRSAISTIQTVSRIVNDPALFIEHTTKRQEPNK